MSPEEQRRDALERAREVRMGGLAVLRELRALPATQSRQRAVELLLAPTEAVARLPVLDLVEAMKYVGQQRCARVMRHAGLSVGSWTRVVGPLERPVNGRTALTARQRHHLARAIEEVLL